LQDSPCNGGCGKCTCLKTEDAIKTYKEAAKSDDYMFGNYNGYDAYKEGR
jgi:hypothetical protein